MNNATTTTSPALASCPTWCVLHDDADVAAGGSRYHWSADRDLLDLDASLQTCGIERGGQLTATTAFVTVQSELSADQLRALALELTAYADRIAAA